MPRERRSTRTTGRTRYTTDAFELAGVTDTAEADEPEVKVEDDDEDFQNNEEGSQEVEDDEDEEDEVESGDEENGPDNPSMMDVDEPATTTPRGTRGRGGTSSKKSKGKETTQPASTKKRRPDGSMVLTGDEIHSRGIFNPTEHVGKALHLQITFGTDERDILAIMYARDRWTKGIDSGFPSRESLNATWNAPDYTYGRTFGADPEDVESESLRGWDWYYHESAGKKFRGRQNFSRIDEQTCRRTYMPKPGKHTVLIGPADNKKEFTLGNFESANFGEAWGETKTKSGAKRKLREGWIMNLGQKIQAMAWAPNQERLTQCLAVVAPISDEKKSKYPDPLAGKVAQAFRSSAPYPCALQLWEFQAKSDNSPTKTLDMRFKPRLRLALCTEWGDLRRIAWCPLPRERRDEDDALKDIGLLAGVWADGCVRVLDIKLHGDPDTTECYKVVSPAFIAKPPSTICTSLVWLSPTDIAVGCANGFVAVWSILPPQDTSTNHPLPYFYQPIHSTYILSITTAYPNLPHLICTTSMDGETRLTSLLDPQKDMVETNRMRTGSPNITYSPWLHSFISSDENDFVRTMGLRRFFATSSIARLPTSVSSMAPSSPCHPSVLIGCTGGTVLSTNPIRRILHSREKQWQQTWFVHEWTRGPGEEGSSGVSRFEDGFRAESVSLLRNMVGDSKMVNGTMVITIFDEGTHVTALAWNPNPVCAGWASAGMGCGLVRVEDVALS